MLRSICYFFSLYITVSCLLSELLFPHQYELVVRAAVSESSNEAAVLVRVTDENDHAPVFPRTLHETQITEEDDRHLPKTILTVGNLYILSVTISCPLLYILKEKKNFGHESS